MNPSQQQVMSALRTLGAAGGGLLAGFAIAKGWVTQSEVDAITSNQAVMSAASTVGLAVLGLLGSAAVGIWGHISNNQVNTVARVAAMPEVSGVTMVPTSAGAALVSAVGPV